MRPLQPTQRFRIRFDLADGTSRYATRYGRVDLRTADEVAQYRPVVDAINAGHLRMGFSRDGEVFTTEELWTEMLGQPLDEFVPVTHVEIEPI